MSYFFHSDLNLEKLEEKDMISFNWLWSKARIIYWGHLNDEATVVKKQVITIFLKLFKHSNTLPKIYETDIRW